MDIVRVVPKRINALRAALGDITFIGFYGEHVTIKRIPVSTDAHINMRRHMHKMPGAGHQGGQSIRAFYPEFGTEGLDRVNQIMVRSGVLRVDLERFLQ